MRRPPACRAATPAVASAATCAMLAAAIAAAACTSPAPDTGSTPMPEEAAAAGEARNTPFAADAEPAMPAGVMDGPAEMGIGVAYLVQQLMETPRSDTVLIRAAPAATAPVLARYILDVRSGGSWTWRIEPVAGAATATPTPPLVLNSLEFAYEEAGLPLDSLVVRTGDGAPAEWARVIYAREAVDTLPGSSAAGPITAGPGGVRRTHDAALRRGWLPLAPGRMERILWAEHLPLQTLFLLAPVQARFLDAPGGNVVDTGVPSPDTDHIMYPLQRRGRWLQVEVVTPSDYCWETLPQTRRTVAWIPFLDDGGRARVWYFSRGC